MYNFIESYAFVLIAGSIVGGVLNFFQLIRFLQLSKEKFVSIRKPTLVVTYCVITLFISFIISPLNWYFQLLDLFEFGAFVCEFIHETLNAFLLIIVLGRCYLLYFDYKFSESQLDKLWRGLINPNEQNFWLKHRTTWGTVKYVWRCIFCTFFIAFLGLFIVGLFIYRKESHAIIFHYFTMFGIAIPFFVILIFFICKINSLSDVYFITQELKYLSMLIMLRSIAFIITMDAFEHDDDLHHLLFYSTEIITQVLTVWVQTWWVIHKYKQTQNDPFYQVDLSQEINQSKCESRKQWPLTMIDMFEQKKSTEMFLRHCVNELSVEHVLFLIETAQFKASLKKYNVGDRSLIYNQMNVDSKAFYDAVVNKLKGSQMVSVEVEAKYKRFQKHILNKSWLPIAMPLKATVLGLNSEQYEHDDGTEKAMYDVSVKSSSLFSGHSTTKPIELTVSPSFPSILPVADASSSRSELKGKYKTKQNIKTVDIDWIYDYSRHLYFKYVDNSAELMINLPHNIRNELCAVYRNENHNAAFNKIQLIHHEKLSIKPLLPNEELMFIQTYLYHSFDCAFDEIWRLLAANTFFRFAKTPQYDILCKKVNLEKLKMKKKQREIEHPRSRAGLYDVTIGPV